MKYETLKTAAETITMPEEMKHRIAESCKTQIQLSRKEHIMMKSNTNHTIVRKPAALVAALAICLSLSVTVLGATGVLGGFFQDITDFRGAIVGTSYHQATDEIGVNVTVQDNELTVHAAFMKPQTAPYSEAQKLGIAAYQIVDTSRKVVKDGTNTEFVELVDGQADIWIPLDDIEGGSYKLIITAFITEKKADQPLNISGNWECSFRK